MAPRELLTGRDTLELYLPLKTFMAHAFRGGEVPVWYPYDGLGFSVPGSLLAGILDPSNLLLLVMSPAAAVKWSVLLCYPLAAAGGYYLGRALKLPVLAACAVGIAFSASGYLLSQSANLLYLEGAARLPWLLGAAESLARRGRTRDSGILALAAASLLWAGDVETAALSAPVCAAIFAMRSAKPRAWAMAVSGAAAALLLNAPLLGPAWQTYRGASRASALGVDEALSWSLHPLRIPELVLGSPVHLNGGLGAITFALGGQSGAFWSESVFLGAATCLLAVLGIAAGRHAARGYAAVGGGALLLALGHHVGAYRRVPGLMHFRYPEKLVLWVTLAVAIAAGAGIARLRRGKFPPLLLAGFGASAAIIGAVATLWLPGYRRATISACVAIGLLAVAGRISRRRVRVAASLALLAAELLAFNPRLLHHASRRDLAFSPPPIPGLEPGDRICSDLAFGPFAHSDGSIDFAGFTRWQLAAGNLDWPALDGFRTTLSLAPTLPRELDRLCGVPNVCTDACARMLGARWRVLPVDQARRLAGDPSFREAARWSDPALVAFEDVRAPAYASLRPALEYADAWQLERALHEGTIAPEDHAFVPRAHGRDWGRYAGRGDVEVELARPGLLRAATVGDAPSVLAVREAFTAGWRAWIDGVPAEVVPVDLGMVGLAVPGGRHHVELTFIPWTWPGAWLLYALGWCAVLVLLQWRASGRDASSATAREST